MNAGVAELAAPLFIKTEIKYIKESGTVPEFPIIIIHATVAELADAHDSESCGATRGGSIPSCRISILRKLSDRRLPAAGRRTIQVRVGKPVQVQFLSPACTGLVRI